MTKLSYSNSSRTFPLRMNDQMRTALHDVMTHYQINGAAVLRMLLMAEHRKVKRLIKQQTKSPGGGEPSEAL